MWYRDEIAFTNLMECASYSLNFYVYCLTNGEIRKAVATTLRSIVEKVTCKSQQQVTLN